jgi:nicotinamidase-related amidase
MTRDRFPLSSEQLELLLAFEATGGSLTRLAEVLRRDPSVVSRNLTRLGEDAAVLEKVAGRWRLTDAGKRVNAASRHYLGQLGETLVRAAAAPSALVLINAQQALAVSGGGDDSRGRDRSNHDAEANARRLLARWRELGWPIAHVKHVSARLESAFHPSRASSAFMPGLEPQPGEWVVEKTGASAFSQPRFHADLRDRGIDALVLAGFTANECVDATAKQARDLGYAVAVAEDATAMFDVVGPDGEVYPSEPTQQALMANLHQSGAKILSTDRVLALTGSPSDTPAESSPSPPSASPSKTGRTKP